MAGAWLCAMGWHAWRRSDSNLIADSTGLHRLWFCRRCLTQRWRLETVPQDA